MNLSYWEIKSWFTNIDFTIVGSGIVGLSCALHLKEQFPKAIILVLEKGMLPQGASTKNAGFACFGSLSEILEDLKSHSEEEVFNLVTILSLEYILIVIAGLPIKSIILVVFYCTSYVNCYGDNSLYHITFLTFSFSRKKL